MDRPIGETTVLRAPAKLTTELRISGVREDGYHLLDAEMVTVSLFDELEIAPGDGLAVVNEVEWVGDQGEERVFVERGRGGPDLVEVDWRPPGAAQQ